MRCARCGHENKEGAKFCNECGNKLEVACAACATPNPPGSKFCSECGSPLTAPPPTSTTHPSSGKQTIRRLARKSRKRQTDSRPQTPDSRPVSCTPPHLAARIRAEQVAIEARGATDGERKTITALFADIEGSMELSEDLDPEEARRIIDRALRLMTDTVHRYEGYVAQSTGDSIFALFGAPIAHEDHAQRALYAALRMQEEIRRYAEKLQLEKEVNVETRVGLNTGEVVVRSIGKDDLHTDYIPIDHSTSLAARIENLATGGSIVVSEQTYKLTEGYFQFKALGEAKVQGVSKPVHIYEVVGVGPLRTRLQVAARRGLVRFVGRQSELEQLQKALELTGAGHGQIVGVMGEPGVGKSRLFYEFVGAQHAASLPQHGCLVLETFSVSHGKAYAYLPLIELLRNYFQLTPHDDERRVREKVVDKVLILDRILEDTLPYLFALLAVEESTSTLQQMDPQLRQRRIFEAIKRLLVRESLNQPLILIFEDLHWLDDETQAFLSVLSEGVATARILLLVNYRPGYQQSWGSKTYYTQLRLDPLGREDAQELLTALLGEGIALQYLKPLILERAGGNPFFMEEIVQSLYDQGVLVRDGAVSLTKPLTDLHVSWAKTLRVMPTWVPLTRLLADIHIPPTVQGVLAARIDRLPPTEKELLQTLAVIGKEFSLSLLQQVVERPEDQLDQLLSHLQTAEFIYEQPAFPEVEYTFKHALTQEVAYNSLLLERRSGLHERTARAIEELYRDRLEDYYSELAHHYSRSGNTKKAVEYLQLTGQQAVQRSANTEAISHLTTALELLKTLPDTSERIQQELTLQIALGTPLIVTKGYGAAEVGKAYTRARELCRQGGETTQLFPVLGSLWQFYLVRAEYQMARGIAEQLLTLAQAVQDSTLLLGAHDALGQILHFLGEFAAAQAHLEQGITFYDPQQHRSLAFLLGGEEPGVACRGYAAWALWCLGYPDQALKRIHEALTLARELSSPFDLAWALDGAAWLHQLRREGQIAQERAEAAVTLSTEQGFPFFSAMGTVLRGWALAEQGQGEEGIARIHQGMIAFRATGAELFQPCWFALLAEAYRKVGKAEAGLIALAEALATVNRTRERWCEAELYRLKGELLLRMGEWERGRRGEGVREWEKGRAGAEITLSPTPPLTHSSPEECFRQAIAIARRQQAKSWELRAVMSLSRLWQQQGKKADARRMLAEIYDWFSEGFDTADLQEARVLLEELTH